jgi:hypothetical protein
LRRCIRRRGTGLFRIFILCSPARPGNPGTHRQRRDPTSRMHACTGVTMEGLFRLSSRALTNVHGRFSPSTEQRLNLLTFDPAQKCKQYEDKAYLRLGPVGSRQIIDLLGRSIRCRCQWSASGTVVVGLIEGFFGLEAARLRQRLRIACQTYGSDGSRRTYSTFSRLYNAVSYEANPLSPAGGPAARHFRTSLRALMHRRSCPEKPSP